jgi:hypothetical protein
MVPEKITLVECTKPIYNLGTIHHCEVCSSDDLEGLKKALESAEWHEYGEFDEETKSRHYRGCHEGIVREYDNRDFTVRLILCNEREFHKSLFVTFPDGRAFIVTVKPETIMNLLEHGKFEMGVCKNKVAFDENSQIIIKEE